MSIRTRIAGIASAVGATTLAAKLAGQPAAEVGAEGVIPSQPEVKRLPRTKESWYQRWMRERPQRLRYYASYKGGKHRRGVPAHIQQQYQIDAEAKRQRKNAKRALEHGHGVI